MQIRCMKLNSPKLDITNGNNIYSKIGATK